ncbi:MAG TPA: allantoinase AllB [Thermomicrobiales bacterium]
MPTTIIEGGTIVTDTARFRADVIISGERISGIMSDARGILADERIDATGLLVLPGGIDARTNFREPDEFTKEGFASGGAGAAAGGITTVVEMPQADPTTVTPEQFRAKRDRVRRAAIVDMALWGGIVGEPRQDADMVRDMAVAGAAGFTSYMAASVPDFPAIDTDKLLWAMRVVAETGLPYSLHAEDDVLLSAGLRRTQGAGRKDPVAHAESRPPVVEAVAVAVALYLAEATGCWVHISHCASAEALRLIADARARGVRVTVDTCPHYLALTTDDLVERKGFARCAPSLRDEEEVEAIWPYVLDETVDTICSDHCGLTAESKAAGDEDIFRAPLGVAGVQTLLPVFYDAAVHQRGMDETQFVRQISTNPARIFGLYPRKGTIAIGADADLVLFDPNRSWTVRGEDMLHKQKWTPFEGKTIRGRVVRTLRRGETIYDASRDGAAQVPAAPGSGRFLPYGYGEREESVATLSELRF